MISWKIIQQILSENNMKINVYTLNAFIILFQDSNSFGDSECKEIDEWLTNNYDSFDADVKEIVIDYFIKKDGFTWLSSYCSDMSKKTLEYKKIRFATITYSLDSLTDNSLNNFIELNDCFSLFVEKMDQPDFFNKVTMEKDILDAIEAIKRWLHKEKLYIMENEKE